MSLNHWAVIESDTITNVVICEDATYGNDQGWMELEGKDPMPWMGWTLVDGVWTPPPPPEEPPTA